MEEFSPFGCMAETNEVHCDLTEPADPSLIEYLEQTYGPFDENPCNPPTAS
jgi:hypothetical protein